jgi:glycosyltransferase involved in cell wall biosynthesis
VRVLLVNDVAFGAASGTEVYLERLRTALERAGDTVETFAGRIRHRGIGKVLDVWDPIARRSLARVATSFGPDVVHHHNVFRELSASVLGVPAGVATVLTVHDLRILGAPEGRAQWRQATTRLKSRLDAAIARRRVHVVIAVSGEIARRLRARGFPHVETVPAAGPDFDDTTSDLAPTDATDVVFVGRLSEDKGPHVLLEAFARIQDRHPAAQLLLAGDGPQRSRLEAMARGSGGRIVLLGRIRQPDVRSLLGRARVVVVPSIPTLRPEGLPLAAIDAALAGRPVVASDDPGLREFVARTGCGLLVRPGSSEDLARALDQVLSDPELATRLGRAGAATAAQHSSQAVAEATHAVYRRASALARGLDALESESPSAGRELTP